MDGLDKIKSMLDIIGKKVNEHEYIAIKLSKSK